jgi:hypothetical protein
MACDTHTHTQNITERNFELESVRSAKTFEIFQFQSVRKKKEKGEGGPPARNNVFWVVVLVVVLLVGGEKGPKKFTTLSIT